MRRLRRILDLVDLFLERREPLLVVTGCGRSGTQYTAKLFEMMGLRSEHEAYAIGKRQKVVASWPLVVDAATPPWGPPLSRISYRPLVVVHQVRHPLKVIGSVQTFEPLSWNFIAGHIPCDMNNPLKRAMQYWLHWNEIAESKATFTYQLENISWQIDRLLGLIKVKVPKQKIEHALAVAARDMNARPHAAVTWDDLRKEDAALAERIRTLARRYGYSD